MYGLHTCIQELHFHQPLSTFPTKPSQNSPRTTTSSQLHARLIGAMVRPVRPAVTGYGSSARYQWIQKNMVHVHAHIFRKTSRPAPTKLCRSSGWLRPVKHQQHQQKIDLPVGKWGVCSRNYGREWDLIYGIIFGGHWGICMDK